MTMVLLAMIPKLVQSVLLHFFNLSRGFCQQDKGSASHDSQVSRKVLLYVLCYQGGSARKTRVLLELIPETIERVLLDLLWFC